MAVCPMRMVLLALSCAMVLSCTTPARAQGAPDEFRTLNGTRNNVDHPAWGSAGMQLRRMPPADYADRISEPAGPTRQSAREISNLLAKQLDSILNHVGASDFIWQWGQFIDHDLDLTTEATPKEPLLIAVPVGDDYFDPDSTGTQTISFNRSIYDAATGTSPKNPRQQLNLVTAFIDASHVYGSDEERAHALRTNDGTGKLQTTSGGQFLPFNMVGLPNAGGDNNTKLFLAGDIRANEQIALTAMHTLFVREHNRLCDAIQQAEPGLTGEEVYQRARKIVGALMQVITYHEFLPLLLGPDALPPYTGYHPQVNPAIANEFSTAAFRVGHTMLSPTLLRVNKPGNELVPTTLKDAFFNPQLIHKGGGIEPLLRGLATQPAQEMDTRIVDGVRNFLFGEPGQGGFDLAALNIQRGRDHGLADYNTVRKAYGLRPVKQVSDITSKPEVQAALQAAYASVDAIDLWVGGLAEDYVPGALVGATFHAILVDQFTRLRDGDRFWFQTDPFFTEAELTEIEQTTLADIIRRNTRIADEIPDDVFLIQE